MIDNQLLEVILNSERVVGTKQVLKNIEGKTVKCVIVADNADSFIKNQVIAAAKDNGITVYHVPTKEALGKICEIDVSAAAVGLK